MEDNNIWDDVETNIWRTESGTDATHSIIDGADVDRFADVTELVQEDEQHVTSSFTTENELDSDIPSMYPPSVDSIAPSDPIAPSIDTSVDPAISIQSKQTQPEKDNNKLNIDDILSQPLQKLLLSIDPFPVESRPKQSSSPPPNQLDVSHTRKYYNSFQRPTRQFVFPSGGNGSRNLIRWAGSSTQQRSIKTINEWNLLENGSKNTKNIFTWSSIVEEERKMKRLSVNEKLQKIIDSKSNKFIKESIREFDQQKKIDARNSALKDLSNIVIDNSPILEDTKEKKNLFKKILTFDLFKRDAGSTASSTSLTRQSISGSHSVSNVSLGADVSQPVTPLNDHFDISNPTVSRDTTPHKTPIHPATPRDATTSPRQMSPLRITSNPLSSTDSPRTEKSHMTPSKLQFEQTDTLQKENRSNSPIIVTQTNNLSQPIPHHPLANSLIDITFDSPDRKSKEIKLPITPLIPIQNGAIQMEEADNDDFGEFESNV